MSRKNASLFMNEKESTILQWKYLLQIVITFIGFVLILLFKGPGHKPSIVGVERCDPAYWGLFGTMFVFAFIMTAIAVWI